ncbi:hypothetical protein B0H16DRAFT_402080 [Mycena metata]|uniref:Uncharacterized protein n=1 Tax=Mycena metata TaxID=1033252 RepID=A0AAD7NLY5_9AGAR|nr:hypothetical protein B0H16DRAFT_402080 [Mycena metata]
MSRSGLLFHQHPHSLPSVAPGVLPSTSGLLLLFWVFLPQHPDFCLGLQILLSLPSAFLHTGSPGSTHPQVPRFAPPISSAFSFRAGLLAVAPLLLDCRYFGLLLFCMLCIHPQLPWVMYSTGYFLQVPALGPCLNLHHLWAYLSTGPQTCTSIASDCSSTSIRQTALSSAAASLFQKC